VKHQLFVWIVFVIARATATQGATPVLDFARDGKARMAKLFDYVEIEVQIPVLHRCWRGDKLARL
jgi:hypothetical protein